MALYLQLMAVCAGAAWAVLAGELANATGKARATAAINDNKVVRNLDRIDACINALLN
jgi:hypothetical protein